jgi:glutathione reductase (NADPH)
VADTDFDLFVIGAGSAGVRAARMSAGFGARVAVAETYRPGGTCVIRGCIPKKLLVYAAHYREDFEDARAYGWSAAPEFSWRTLISNKNREIALLEDVYRTLLKSAGAQLIEGQAHIVDNHTVEVASRRYGAKHLLVATGGWPTMPAVPGIEHCISSNEALELPALPRRVLIVGGGYVACEFAGIFHGLGSAVTLVYRGDQILRGFDEDVRQHLYQEFVRRGIDVRLDCNITGVERRADGSLEARLTAAGRADTTIMDAVMFATGRHPNTAGLGLEAAGVQLRTDGAVIVDEYSRSSVENVFAVGDVTQRIALTPVAIREGAAVANTLFGGAPTPVDHVNVPHAVFCLPPVSFVGLSETQARKMHGAIEVFKTTFRPLKYTLSGRNERTLMKLVVDAATRRVLGAHMVGPDAPEIIQGIAIAVKAGLTKQQFDSTVALHPTAAEEFVTLRQKT